MAAPSVFPIYGQPFVVPAAFVDQNGNLITDWQNASAEYSLDGATVTGTAASPVEDVDSSMAKTGIGSLSLAAGEMAGNLIHIKMSISNSGATQTVLFVYTEATTTSGVRASTPIAKIDWLFQYFFGGGSIQRGTGFQTVLNDDGSTLTTIFVSGTDTNFIKGMSNP